MKKENKAKSDAAVELGRKGGTATFNLYGKEQMAKWGKMGGRPRKTKIFNNEQSKTNLNSTTQATAMSLRSSSSQESVQ